MRCVRRYGGGPVLGALAALGVACATGTPTRAAEDGPSEQHFEYWTGAQAFDHVWSLYSGATVAPLGGIRQDGLRLRVVGGYGAYSYSGPRAVGLTSQVVKFHGTSTFGDVLAGYHHRFGPLTVKAFAGLAASNNLSSPDDPETVIRGSGIGGKIALESWLDIGDRAWSAIDVTWGSLHDTYAARARLGWRFGAKLSAGLETGAAGNVECDVARLGGFLRYEWSGGEVSVSGGASNGKLLDGLGAVDAAKSSVPFATLSWLTRF